VIQYNFICVTFQRAEGLFKGADVAQNGLRKDLPRSSDFMMLNIHPVHPIFVMRKWWVLLAKVVVLRFLMWFYHVLSMESHGFMILHRSCLMTTARWDANPRELNHFESRSTLPMGVNHFLPPVGSKIITSNGWWIQKKTGLRLQANDEAAVAHKNYLSLIIWSFNIAMENHHFE